MRFVPEEQAELAERFGAKTGDELDKFACGMGARPGAEAEAEELSFRRAKRIEPGHEA